MFEEWLLLYVAFEATSFLARVAVHASLLWIN